VNQDAPKGSSVKPTQAKRDPISLNLLTSSAAFFALLYIVACLIGYGAALAIESQLAVPADALFSSSLDLVVLSKYPLLALLGSLEDAWPRLGTYVLETSLPFWVVALGVALWARFRWRFGVAKWAGRFASAAHTTIDRFSALPRDATPGQRAATLLSGTLIAVPPLAAFGPILIMVLASFPVLATTFVGFQGTKSYIDRWVLTNVECQAKSDRASTPAHQSITALPCIRLGEGSAAVEAMVLVSSPTTLVVRSAQGVVSAVPAVREGGLQVVGELRPASP
jgi:hypothetical protein